MSGLFWNRVEEFEPRVSRYHDPQPKCYEGSVYGVLMVSRCKGHFQMFAPGVVLSNRSQRMEDVTFCVEGASLIIYRFAFLEYMGIPQETQAVLS